MTLITLQQANKIIETRKNLEHWRAMLKKIDAAVSVEITISHATGKVYYGNPVTELIKYQAMKSDSKLAKSVTHAIRQEWSAKEAECIRTLVQLGAEVPK